jgi:hypothetical protein
MKLKPMARAVHNALQYIGEQWRIAQWHREHGGGP